MEELWSILVCVLLFVDTPGSLSPAMFVNAAESLQTCEYKQAMAPRCIPLPLKAHLKQPLNVVYF